MHQLVYETCVYRVLFDIKFCSAIGKKCKDVSVCASWQAWVTLLSQSATTSFVYDMLSTTSSFAATEDCSVLATRQAAVHIP